MPASPSTARAINDRRALQLLQEKGPLTAGQLKTLTGLSRPSVADLVERLQGEGLIAVVGESGAERRGPNARVYGIVAERAYLAALDVRTDSVGVGVADLLGRTLAEATLTMGEDVPTEQAVEAAVALLERTARGAGATTLHTVGIGAPGLIDPATGELRDSAKLPPWHRRLVAVLQERLPATVLVENETNLAAVAEQRLGSARGHDTFVFLWLADGVGAAVVLDGKVRRGASGGAGEVGFLPVPGARGLPSATDCDGGFHSLVGGAAVCELAAAHGLSGTAATHGLSGTDAATHGIAGTGTGTDAAAVLTKAMEAGEAAEPFLDAFAERLALGAASVTAILDPGCVVLGGEIGHAGGKALAARVEARLAELSPLRTEVRASELGDGAILGGALLVAREAAQNELFGK